MIGSEVVRLPLAMVAGALLMASSDAGFLALLSSATGILLVWAILLIYLADALRQVMPLYSIGADPGALLTWFIGSLSPGFLFFR